MIIPIAGLVMLLSPLLVRGRLGRFALVRLRHKWVIVAALLAQVVILEVVPGSHQTVLSAVHLLTYAMAGVFVWLNRQVPGLMLIAAGALSNGVTIALNEGTLPASARAVREAGLALHQDDFLNSGVLADPVLPWLGDVFWIPAGLPLANVFSIGDVLIVLGIGWASHRVSGSRLLPARWRWEPTDSTGSDAVDGADDAPADGDVPWAPPPAAATEVLPVRPA